MKLFISILVGVIVVAVGFWVFTNQTTAPESVTGEDRTYTYVTDTTEFSVVFSEDGSDAQLKFNGEQYLLKNVVSASGAKYANEDESVVFWEHQGEAMVEIDGQMVVQVATPTRRRVEVLKSNKQGDPDTSAQIANPAATFCVEQGGQYEAESCLLTDGTKVDAWEYFRDHKGDDPNANKYDFGANDMDQDCDGPTGECQLDDDDDNDTVLDDTAAANVSGQSNAPAAVNFDSSASMDNQNEVDAPSKATDYNSSRSNKSTSRNF